MDAFASRVRVGYKLWFAREDCFPLSQRICGGTRMPFFFKWLHSLKCFFFFSLPFPFSPRLGLIFVVNDSEDVDGMQDAGVALLRAYNYVAQEMDDYHAFQTLTHVCFHSKWQIIF